MQNNATTVAGDPGLICSIGIVVGCADPVLRGQRNTIQEPGELAVAENVTADWDYEQPPNAGTPFTTHVRCVTSESPPATYDYEVEEDQTTLHTDDGIDVEAPD